MKTVLIILIASIIIASSCKKSGIPTTPSPMDTAISILGKWNIVNDSVLYNGLSGYNGKNYIGLPTDYYDFKSNDSLYVKEGGLYADKYNYSSSVITFPAAGTTKYKITILTDHNMTLSLITKDLPYTPEYSIISEIINLKR